MPFLRSKIFTVLALLAVAGLVWSVARLWPQKITVENRVKSLEQRIAETEKSNSALARLLDYFKSPSYLEREAKLKLNVRKSDENVVFIYPGKGGQAEQSRALEEKKQVNIGIGATNFEKWIKYLLRR